MIGDWTRRDALAAIGAAGLLPGLAHAQPRSDFLGLAPTPDGLDDLTAAAIPRPPRLTPAAS